MGMVIFVEMVGAKNLVGKFAKVDTRKMGPAEH
jgi:hypothetical protein